MTLQSLVHVKKIYKVLHICVYLHPVVQAVEKCFHVNSNTLPDMVQ